MSERITREKTKTANPLNFVLLLLLLSTLHCSASDRIPNDDSNLNRKRQFYVVRHTRAKLRRIIISDTRVFWPWKHFRFFYGKTKELETKTQSDTLSE